MLESVKRVLTGKESIVKVCRGVRGATTADRNSREEILKATMQLLALMIRQNGIDSVDVASAIFSTTAIRSACAARTRGSAATTR